MTDDLWPVSIGMFRVKGGWCAAAWTRKGLCALTLPTRKRAEAFRKLSSLTDPGNPGTSSKPPSDIVMAVRLALSGKPFRPPKTDLSALTEFQRRILRATATIPLGQTRSYAWTAGKAGSPLGCRAAGQALHANPIPLLIPCHRVVESGGGIGGFGGGLRWKRFLLRLESTRR